MPVLQLRSHSPIGGPIQSEPVDGSETAMRISLGFEPDWFHRRCGVDFGEQWHTDPYYRHESLVRMKQELHRAFPAVSDWDPANREDTWTLSGCYGTYLLNRVFGFNLEYAPNLWPWPDVSYRGSISLEMFARMKVEELLAGPFMAELFRQMDAIEREGGKIHGYLDWQGVLSNAFNLCGQTIFTEMVYNPQLVHDFFSLICDVMITVARKVQARQRESGFFIDQLSVNNCTISMVSPKYYRKFGLPYDRRIAESFERFGVHTCNLDVTPYLETVAELPLGYLDIGIMSDMKRVKATFPQARRALIYSPIRLAGASPEELRADMELVYQELAPCDVVIADIQATTPDSRVNELLEICRELESEVTG